ncbi:SHOCT domain-containing protein [Microtetraspora malaysiensis]|uniref:SHOCT domain-containing protein n=1 Tax=Microtetraspora malaysiensis TaxID=161358 RepID=UPI003D8F42CA
MLTPLRLVRRSLGTLVGLGAVSCCLTLLYLGSSTVMSIGGACGSGGPYEIATPCPEGIGWIIPGSIFGGIAGLGLYIASSLPVGPRLTPLAWPALFLSLGYAFLDSALHAGDGVDGGFMVCAVLFILMGGVPLLFLRNRDVFLGVFWGPAPSGPAGGPLPIPRRVVAAPAHVPDPARTPAPAGGALHTPATEGGLVGELERLAALHQAGRIDDAEYTRAKNLLLNGPDA